MCFFAVYPVVGQDRPAPSPGIIIIDLSQVKLPAVTREYPSLWKLVTRGAAAVVSLTNAVPGDSLVHRLRKQRPVRDSMKLAGFHELVTPSGVKASRAPDVLRQISKAGGILILAPEARKPNLTAPGVRGSVPAVTGVPSQLIFYDRLLEQILMTTDLKITMLLACFSSEWVDPGIKKVGLGAVVCMGLGLKPGVLYSPSTRKPGIITFLNLRNLVLQFRNPQTSLVFPLQSRPGLWRNIAEIQSDLVANYTIRWPVLAGYGYLLLGSLGALAGGLLSRASKFPYTVLTWFYLFLLAVPAAFLLMAIINPLDWTGIILDLLGITGGLFLSAYFLGGRKPAQAFALLSSLTSGLVLAGGLWNGYYEYRSLLGYSVVAGGRYYGIGNEYMGVLLGAYIAGISLIIDKSGPWRRNFLWVAAFFITVILVHPSLGADVGGGISALIGLGITNYLWLGQPVRFREIAQLCLLTGLALTLAGIWDLWLNRENMSHWGQLLLAVKDRGWEAFLTIVARKLEMNLGLIRDNPLAILLLVLLVAIPVIHRYPPAIVKKLMAKYPLVISGFTGLSITALAGFLVNDSGIVSAAMIFMFGTGLLVLMAHQEVDGPRPEQG